MPDIRDLPVMTKADAESIGFAGFNDVPHKVLDLPDGDFTISVKTSDGRRVSFNFQPYSPNGPARFVDIQFHDRGTTIANADAGRSPTFNAFAITKGGRHIVDSRALTEDIKPSILVLLLDTAHEEKARATPLKGDAPGSQRLLPSEVNVTLTDDDALVVTDAIDHRAAALQARAGTIDPQSSEGLFLAQALTRLSAARVRLGNAPRSTR